MCALHVRCALSLLQKECRKVWGARYTLGVRYRLENMVLCYPYICVSLTHTHTHTHTHIYILFIIDQHLTLNQKATS